MEIVPGLLVFLDLFLAFCLVVLALTLAISFCVQVGSYCLTGYFFSMRCYNPLCDEPTQPTPPPWMQPAAKKGKGVLVLLGPLSPLPKHLHFDECCTRKARGEAQDLGFNYTSAHTAGLCGASDAKQLAYAARERRILVTHDKGFFKLHKAGKPHAGIIIVPRGDQWNQELFRVAQ